MSTKGKNSYHKSLHVFHSSCGHNPCWYSSYVYPRREKAWTSKTTGESRECLKDADGAISLMHWWASIPSSVALAFMVQGRQCQVEQLSKLEQIYFHLFPAVSVANRSFSENVHNRGMALMYSSHPKSQTAKYACWPCSWAPRNVMSFSLSLGLDSVP